MAVASFAASNVTVYLAVSGFPSPAGAVLHQDADPLRLCLERLIVAAGAPSRHLAAVSSEESEGGGAGPPVRAGSNRQEKEGAAGGLRRPAEPRGLHGQLTRRQADPRGTMAESSGGPCTSAHRLTPARTLPPGLLDGRKRWQEGRTVSVCQVPGQPIL